ncbi:tetratricopeptide repeat protein [Nannocystis pusilla]|uniref:Tetratricopeptide repeat protein n=2 Tax=Nannocystis pusilla TaxID=889268 RepID=A0ABS7TY62_9BACT|nr:tetratricopeptide repeat protein [Nannocystis pusilla]MBZ5712966.1 tetratricopeptide repeat protein [Nannocystis pusilla]
MALDVLAEDDVEPPQQPARAGEARHERTVAAAPLPVEPPHARAPGRGVYAALGVFASAALVLLALQIVGPNLAAIGSEPGAQKQDDPTAIEAPRTLVDSKQDEKHLETKNDPPPETKDAKVPAETTTPPSITGEKPPNPAQATTSSAEPGGDTTGSEATTDAQVPEAPHGTDTNETAGKANGTAIKPPNDKPPNTGIKKAAKKTIEERVEEGCFQVRARDAELGVKILQAVRAERPYNIETLRCLAQGLQTMGDYPEAEKYYEELIQATNPRNLIALLGLAQVNELMTRYDRAAEYYERVRRIDPDNKSAQAFFESKQGAARRAPAPVGFELKR